jgi:hypothetical protein
MPVRLLPLIVFGLALAAPAGASADCRDSASGVASVAISLSLSSGILCLNDVAVHRGAGCGGEPEWTATLGCDETRRMVVKDDGVLVNLRAPRPNRRDWEIIRTFTHETGVVVVRSIRFDRLPGIPPAPARPRLNLAAHGLRIGEGPSAALLPLARIVELGRRTGRR